MDKIITLLNAYRGQTPVVIYMAGSKPLKAPENMYVRADEEFLAAAALLLGAENVKY